MKLIQMLILANLHCILLIVTLILNANVTVLECLKLFIFLVCSCNMCFVITIYLLFVWKANNLKNVKNVLKEGLIRHEK